MKRTPVLASLFLATFILTVAVACGSSDDDGPTPLVYSFGLSSQVVASGADAAAVRAIEFAPDGRIFYTQQFTGQIKIVNPDGTIQAPPFASLQVGNYLDLDWGLTGLALDPDFATNNYVYAFYTSPIGTDNTLGKPTIVRYTDSNGTGIDQRVISDEFPETFANHQGYNANGEIHFGPDGFLYASVGDYDQGTAKPEEGGQPELVEDLSTPIGKLLRMNKADGSAAPGNPFEDDPDADARVFAFGFREPFSFAFDPTSGALYGTDNTPDTCEELNVIEAGQGYGWPSGWVFPFGDCSAGEGTEPIGGFAREGKQPGDFLSLVETQGLTVLEGSIYSQLTDGIVTCQSQKSVVNNVPSGGALVRTIVTGNAVTATDIIVRDCKGTAFAHAGEIYYSNGTQLLKLIEAPVGTADGNTQQQAPPPGG